MKILHVSEVAWGGVVNLIQQFTFQQLQRGDDVVLLTPRCFPPVDPRVERLEWSIDRAAPATYFKALRELTRAVQDCEPDVVHLHSFIAGFLGRFPMSAGGVPLVYQPHAWSFDLKDARTFRHGLQAWERFAGRRTNLLVTNCEEEIDEGHRVGVAVDGVSIGVAIDVDHFRVLSEIEQEQARRELSIETGHVLVCIGRLARQKGQDLLVRQWEDSPLPDTTLLLVGPGDSTALQELAPVQWGKTIRAVGETTDVRPYLAAADALVLSSRYETVALVVAEAMACGRPVVATAVNGATEVLTGGNLPPAGIVVPVGDMKALIRATAELLQDDERRKSMALAGRERAVRQFTPAAVVDVLASAYGLASASPGGTAARSDGLGGPRVISSPLASRRAQRAAVVAQRRSAIRRSISRVRR